MKHRMNRKAIISLIVAIVAIICIVTTVAICHLVRENKLEYIQNEILAELERNEGKYDERSIVLDSTSKARAEELAALFGAELRITENGRYARLTLPEGVSVKDIWSDDENREYLEEMSADYQVSIAELESEEDKYRIPMRPNYTVSDSEYSLQTYLDYINMQNVWSYGYTGSGVTVAVIDTGIDTDHPEFAGRISEYSYNATEDKIVKDWMTPGGNYDWSLIEDEQGHGTAVAGVIAGTMNSGNIIGIAPNVNIIVIKAECDEFGNFYRTSDLVFGLYYAIERDVQVVNMSFGTSGPINPFAEAAQLAYDSDIICVAAAGNNGTSALTWPAADENVIGVGALEENSWTLASYSNYGENSDIVAPGTTYTSIMGGKYGSMNGTSLSSPIVVGAIALFMQNNRYTTFDDVEEVLYASSYDLGALGEDWDYGYGALDVDAFVLGERGTVTFDMLTDELENEDGLFIRGIALQSLPEPERLYAVFDGWYYDDTFTQAVDYYADAFEGDLTLYAKWVNEDDGIPYTYVILEDGTVEIRSYTGHRRFITVPEKIEGRVVSSIGDFAFSGQTRLREVGLPSGLTNIGRYAFENCSNLVSIEIPAGVKKIGDYAFENNVRLYTVAFAGNSVLESIGEFAFSGCGSLERIELPASLTSVNGSAFFGTTALTAITVRNGNVAFISKDGVLFDITSTTLVAYPAAHGITYTVPEGTINLAYYSFPMARIKNIDLGTIQTIGKGAFVYSTLESLMIPDSVISMGESAFEYNTNLTSLSIGRGLTAISAKAFAECSSLKAVTIPNGISLIDTGAFWGSGLASVVFESGSTLSAIGPSAFYNCQLKEIDIPASVTTIGSRSFEGNPLERVGFASDSQLTLIGSEAFAKCYPLESIALPRSLKTIGACAFMSSGLKNITVPASVTELGNGAFACCDALTSIEIEDGNTVYHDINGVVYTLDNTVVHMYPAGREENSYTIESAARSVSPWAFAGTSKLGSVTLPEGMTEIGEYGFYLCGAYSYSLPSTLVEIEQYVFSENSNLGNINIPDNVLQIGRYAFAKSNNLYTVNFNTTSKLPRISYGAFAYSGIQYFTVPANVSTIAQGAFEGCKNLYSVTFAGNSKLESISAYMFDGCENLQSITFNNGSALTSIQAHGLEGMDNLTSINFGDAKLTNVDNFAFRFCESLSNITFPDTLTSIGRYAFYGCKSLSELTVPVSVEHIGSYAFLGTNELDLYLAADSMPEYLDENWDHGLKAYYTGVTSVNTSGDYKYATLTSGNIAIIEYLGTAESVDLSTLSLGAPITTIGGSAFKDSTVKAIVLPETLLEIQAEAFMYTALESISIPASVTFIGREAFAHTDIATLNIPANSSLKYIEQYAFEGTEYLKSVTLPASLEKMGTGTFLESGLEVLIFADGIKITEIPQKAFAETNLVSVSLPDSVTLVNHNAFNNVETLTSVSFGNNAGIRLMSNAFYHTGLTSLNIPANVTYIGEYCFVALPNLTEFKVDANNPNYAAIDGLLVTKSGRKLIAVPAGRTGTLNVPVSIEEIGFGAFEESKLSAINFDPNANILTFGYRAFFKAENITEMHIPASVVSIDYYAFAYCENLKTVTFAAGNKLKGIYEGAFCGDINLENIVIPDSIVEISDFAFYGCSKITKLPVSETSALKGIYDYAFAYTGLSGEFTTPETLIDIGNYAFLGCKFTKVTVPDTNKKQLIIGIGAFEGNNKLTEITLPFIGASFEDEEISWFGYIFGAGSYEANENYVPASLKIVTITDGITFVGIGGFAYCTGLEIINIPHSVSVIYDDAFFKNTAIYELTNNVICYSWDWDWESGRNVLKPITKRAHFGTGISGHLSLAAPLNSIGSDTFYGCNFLESIVIPDSVTEIGSYAFCGCYNLEEIILPQNITQIADSTFANCWGMVNIIIPDSVTLIDKYAFVGCAGLTEITIPEYVTSIGNNAFNGCSNITEITIPKNIAYIGASAFEACEKLNRVTNNSELSLILGDTSNGWVAYYAKELYDKNGNRIIKDDSLKFEYLDTPEGLRFKKENEKYTLISYLGKEDTVYLPAKINNCSYELYRFTGAKNVIVEYGITKINDCAFQQGTTIETIVLPDSVTNIGIRSFENCLNLKEVMLSNNLVSIGNLAFTSCENLTNIKLPDTLVSIGNHAFSSCINLQFINFPDKLTSIGDGAFVNTNLISIVIPDSVVSLGSQAFINCQNLESVSLSSSITMLNGTFSGCSKLKSVTLPDNLTQIGNFAFSDCTALERIIIPCSVQSIGGSAFANCVSLSDVQISDGTNSLGIATDAFSGCTNLSKVFIPDRVVSVSHKSFAPDTEIEITGTNPKYKLIDGVLYDRIYNTVVSASASVEGEIAIESGVVRIDSDAFAWCTKLQSVIIPDTVTEIGYYVFYNCSSLRSINIPSSVNSIGPGVFSGCVMLESVKIPNGVTYISPGAFSGCTKLYEVVLPDSVTAIGQYAFEDCISLESITLPKNVSSIEYKAFESNTTIFAVDENPNFVTVQGILYTKPITSIVHCPSNIPSKIFIPEGVTSIDYGAFDQLNSVVSITLPSSVTSIASEVFISSYIYEIINNSSIPLEFGSASNGWIGAFAKTIVDKNGVRHFRKEYEGDSNIEYFILEESYLFVHLKPTDTYKLLAYLGEEESITLPEDIFGHPYDIDHFKGGKYITVPDTFTSIGFQAFYGNGGVVSVHLPETISDIGPQAFSGCINLRFINIPDNIKIINYEAFSSCKALANIIIPDGITRIDSGAFYGCNKLESIVIPNSIESLGWNVFGNTALYNSAENWHNGMLIINGWLVDVDEKVESITNIETIKGAAEGAYYGCYKLKNAVWGGDIEGTTNVETIIVPQITSTGPYDSLTLKNLVITNSASMNTLHNNPQFFCDLTGVSIFVESLENDVKWDANFPGWSNGNRVVYSDSWTWSNFYDADGTLLYSKPRLNSEIIRMPVVDDYESDGKYYKFIGWDLDNDGEIDSVPATSTVDINAHAVYIKYNYCDLFGHDISKVPAKPATCTEIGWNEYDKCSRCDYSTYVELPALTHDISKVPAKPATCTEIGWNEYDKCSRCDYSTYVELPALTHDISKVPAQPATCTSIGWNEYDKCSRCDYSTYVELPMLDHKYISSVIKPDYQVQGYTLHTCEVCGYSFKDNYTDALTYFPGDINGDGKVEKSDASVLIKYLVGEKVTVISEALDVNHDGKVTVVDAITILLYLAGKIESLN